MTKSVFTFRQMKKCAMYLWTWIDLVIYFFNINDIDSRCHKRSYFVFNSISGCIYTREAIYRRLSREHIFKMSIIYDSFLFCFTNSVDYTSPNIYCFILLSIVGAAVILLIGPIESPYEPLTKSSRVKNKIIGCFVFVILNITGTLIYQCKVIGNMIFYTDFIIIILMLTPYFHKKFSIAENKISEENQWLYIRNIFDSYDELKKFIRRFRIYIVYRYYFFIALLYNYFFHIKRRRLLYL